MRHHQACTVLVPWYPGAPHPSKYHGASPSRGMSATLHKMVRTVLMRIESHWGRLSDLLSWTHSMKTQTNPKTRCATTKRLPPRFLARGRPGSVTVGPPVKLHEDGSDRSDPALKNTTTVLMQIECHLGMRQPDLLS